MASNRALSWEARILMRFDTDYRREDLPDYMWWTTSDGKQIPLFYLSDRHIRNIIHFLSDFGEENFYRETIEQLKTILQVRQKRGFKVMEFNNPYYR